MDNDLEPIGAPPPDEAPETAPASDSRRAPVLPIVLVAVALVAAGVTVLVTRVLDRERSPEQLLRAAREHAAEHKRADFTGTLRIESRDPESGGGSFVDRMRIEGTATLPGSARYLLEGDGFASETIAVGTTLYTRDGRDQDDIERKKWAQFDQEAEDQRSGVVRDEGPGAAQEVGDPLSLLSTLDAARNPTRVEREGAVVIRATVNPERAFGAALAEEIDSASVELTLGPEDRIDRALLRASGSGNSLRAEYTFSRWGSAEGVKAPARSDLDPTPGIEEEDIAHFTAARLYQPRGIPAGWVLEAAGVLPPEFTVEDCEQVEIDYTDPESEDSGYLSLFELPKSCAELDLPRGAEEFRAGRWWGYIEEGPDGAYVQIVVGDTVVQADSDLPAEGLARILADLIPLNLSVEPIELTGFENTTSA